MATLPSLPIPIGELKDGAWGLILLGLLLLFIAPVLGLIVLVIGPLALL